MRRIRRYERGAAGWQRLRFVKSNYYKALLMMLDTAKAIRAAMERFSPTPPPPTPEQ